MQDRQGGEINGPHRRTLRWLEEELEKKIQGDPYLNDQYHRSESMSENSVRTGYNKAIRDVRKIFLAPEPEIPEEIKDLLWDQSGTPGPNFSLKEVDKDIIEAFRRGQKAGRNE